MATGDKQDFIQRLLNNIPEWFGENNPLLDATLGGSATQHSFIYSLWEYLKLQTRIITATEENLDLISCDFFGDRVPRRSEESDDVYRRRILSLLFQPKATRPAMFNAIKNLTGVDPIIFESWNPSDCGGYAGVTSVPPYIIGYSVTGKYGSGSYRYQAFIDVFLPPHQGMVGYWGFNGLPFGFNASGGLAVGWYGGQSLLDDLISDQDVYDLISNVKVFGTIVWVRIERDVRPGVPEVIQDKVEDIIEDKSNDPIVVGGT